MILVTGPTGNVGDELVRLLAADPAAPAFRVAAHHPERVRARHGDLPDVVGLDYGDRSTWPAALAGVDALFLLFPLPHPRTARRWMEPFVDAAVSAGVRHVVYVSVPGADRLRFVPHHRVERHIRASGTGWTFLRCSYFMQNLFRAVSTHGVDIADAGEVFIPAGDGRTSFVDARDVAAVALQALTDPARHRDRAYLLTGPQRLHMAEVAALLGRALGTPIRYADPSPLQFWRRMRRRGVGRDTVLFMSVVYALTRRGRNEPLGADLAELLGRPPTPFEAFARDHVQRWRDRDWS